jgi:hypothetical protein
VSNYVKSTNFAVKDGLPSGDPLKVVKGTEIDTEFNNIATSISSKSNLSSPTFIGTPFAPTAAAGTATNQIATTSFVGTAVTNERTATATLTNKTLTSPTISSPSLTGTPTAPTAAVSTNNTQVATTAFATAKVADAAPTKTGGGASGTWGINVTGNAATATSLQTARTIGGVSFNGTANINLPGVNTTGNQNTTGSAASLTTARSINGTNFNGSANITTANWGTARTLTIGSTGKSVNGSGNVSWSLSEIGAPSTTGSGASGTWGISITGNAATASSVAYTNVTGRPASALRQIFNSTLSYATAGSKTFTFRLLYNGSPAREMVSPDSFVIETRLSDFYTSTNNGTVINYTVSKAVALPNNVLESRLVVTISGFNSNLYPNNIIMRIFVQDVTSVTSCTLL